MALLSVHYFYPNRAYANALLVFFDEYQFTNIDAEN